MYNFDMCIAKDKKRVYFDNKKRRDHEMPEKKTEAEKEAEREAKRNAIRKKISSINTKIAKMRGLVNQFRE